MPDELEDFVNASAEQLKYQFAVTLEPDKLMAVDSTLQPLAWRSIPYGHDQIHEVPNDKRGIYAFASAIAAMSCRHTDIFCTSV